MTDNSDKDSKIDRIFAAQQRTALELRVSTAQERIGQLNELLRVFESFRPAIYRAAYDDLRKSEPETDLTEILPVIAEIKHTVRHLRRWMRPQRVRASLMMLGTSARIHWEPRGTSLIIAPWNYPINLAFGPLVGAIAAGCTAIIKPSEMTPHLSRVTREIVEAYAGEDRVAVCEGEVETATRLLALPFDHIFFTGSPAVGKIVMAAAARHLSSVTLELGGKSPTVVDGSVNLASAARKIIWGKLTNSGQTCIAPDYVLVHDSIADQFTEALTEAIEQLYGNDIQANPDYCRIVNRNHAARLGEAVSQACAQGATRVCGADVQVQVQECYVEPTILLDPPADSEVMAEEIFGPVLPIVRYDDLSDAIDLINSRPKPLALYIYSKEKTAIERILAETSAGDTCINNNLLHFLHTNLPFGGVNNSGMGKSHGRYAFEAFSHQRSVLYDRVSLRSVIFPPFGKRTRALYKVAIRLLT